MYGVMAFRLIVGSSRYPSRPKPWVARITGLCEQFGLRREFVKGVYDYTYSSKGTGKNTYMYFNLAPGMYEVYTPVSWKHDERYFVRVDENGNVHTIERQEVIDCVKNVI